MALMDTVDGVLIDSDEDGFYLTLSGAVAEHRFRVPQDVAVELLRAVKREIEPWYLEGERVRAEYEAADRGIHPDAYPPDDPKSERYHDVLSEIWDSRPGK